MPPLKTLLWSGFFAGACITALWSPIWGIIGYLGHYIIGPGQQWWSAPLRPLGLRYSFMLATFTLLGILLNWKRLRFGTSLFHRQEKLMLLFLSIMWLLTILGPETVGRYGVAYADHPTVKMTKVLLFVLMMTHVVTDAKKLNWLLWALVTGALILGAQAYSTPRRAFLSGRLETVGGPDFHDANYFAAYMAGMLFIIGAQFMRSGWMGRIVCFLAGGFTANAIVLTRSRGAFLGVAVGCLMALIVAPKRFRGRIFLGLLLAGLGGYSLSDAQFLTRVQTIAHPEVELDASSSARLEIWRGAVKVILANPQGVGPGNFGQTIRRHAPASAIFEVHSTYLRCAAELGILGLIVLSMVVICAFLLLRRTMKTAAILPAEASEPILWAAYGMVTALTAVLADGLTQTFIYIEFLWLILAMPLCLSRTLDNLVHEHETFNAEDDPSSEQEDTVLEPVGSD